jgi:hypothetical protein
LLSLESKLPLVVLLLLLFLPLLLPPLLLLLLELLLLLRLLLFTEMVSVASRLASLLLRALTMSVIMCWTPCANTVLPSTLLRVCGSIA